MINRFLAQIMVLFIAILQVTTRGGGCKGGSCIISYIFFNTKKTEIFHTGGDKL